MLHMFIGTVSLFQASFNYFNFNDFMTIRHFRNSQNVKWFVLKSYYGILFRFNNKKKGE